MMIYIHGIPLQANKDTMLKPEPYYDRTETSAQLFQQSTYVSNAHNEYEFIFSSVPLLRWKPKSTRALHTS